MIEVELPDGTIAEFPDGTAPDVMKRALQKRFGAPPPPASAQPPSAGMQQGLAEMSAMTQNPAKAQYDALPAWQKPLVAASDVVQLAADGATFGYGDKAVAGARSMFTGKSYEDELAEQRRLTAGAANRAGSAGTAAQITGAVAAPLAAAGKGATLAGRFGTAGMTGAKGLGARTGLMAAEGAGYGALTAAGHDQDIGTGAAFGLAGGAGGNLVGESITAGVGKVAGMFNKKPPRLGVSDLKASASAAYKTAEDAGVIFNRTGIQKLGRSIVDDLSEAAYHPNNEPGVKAALSEILRLSKSQSVTLKGLDKIRKMASNGYIPGNNSNNALVGKIIGRIDEMVDAMDPATMASVKNPKVAAEAIQSARKQWHNARKLETVEELVERGGRMGRTNKSQNVEQTTKRQLRRILDNKSIGRGFTATEKAAANKAIGYTPAQSALDVLSGMMPSGKLSGMVQGSIGAVNMATGNILGLGLQGAGMATGFAARKASEALAKKSVNEFVDLVARGGVPAPVVQNALQRLTASKRDAITRTLMAISVNRGAEAPAYQQ